MFKGRYQKKLDQKYQAAKGLCIEAFTRAKNTRAGNRLGQVFNTAADFVSREKVYKSLRKGFATVALGALAMSCVYLDNSHAHGYTNAYHELYDAVYEKRGATEDQKVKLVEAAIESGEDVTVSNRFAKVAMLSLGGFWVTGGIKTYADRRRKKKTDLMPRP